MSTKRIRRVLAALMSAVMAFSVGGGYILPEAVTVLADEADGSSHNYLNGICQDDDCEDKYEEPELLNGYYQISNAGNLYWFAEQVNSGNNSINAVLVNDIYVNDYDYTANDGSKADITISSSKGTDSKGDSWLDWTPVGTEDYSYAGIFDGSGYAVSGLYFNDSSTNYVGLFGYINDGTVENTGVENSYLYGYNYVGGICGHNYNGIISSCYNTSSVSSKGNCVGGICGDNYNGSINSCYNTGNVSGDLQRIGGICGDNRSGSISFCYNTGGISCQSGYGGGICGFNRGGTGNVSFCYNTGNISGSTNNTTSLGGICGYNNSTVNYCYNTGNISGSSYKGGICGDNNSGTISYCYYLSGTADGGIDSNDVSGSVEVKTEEEFASGEVTYLLNGSSSENIAWYQNIDNGTADNYPVLDDSHSIVYYIDAVYSCPDIYEALETPIYSNTDSSGNKSSHPYENGFCSYCEGFEEPELSDGYYQISNAGELYWFAEQVNSGNTSINAVLINDIYVNDYDYTANDGSQTNIAISSEKGTDSKGDDWLDWTPIGNNSYNYRGTFNGGGYTVSGLYFSNSSTNYVGLFGYITKGTVKNTGVENSYFYGKDYVGGICGISNSGNVSYCYNTGSINSSSRYTGGICGRNFNAAVNCCYNTGSVNSLYYTGGICGSNSSSGTIISCYNTGNVTGSNDYIGGICGYNYSSSTVSSCYNTGIVSGNYAGGICGCNDETVSICYYLSDTAAGGINSSDVSGSAEVRTAEEFSSGEVTYLLNGSSSDSESIVWYQNIDKGTIDSYPVFDSGHNIVYCIDGVYSCPDSFEAYETPIYSNTDSSGNKTSHTYENGVCIYCGAVNLGSLSTDETTGYYIISNADELVIFAAAVNSGSYDINGIVTANIDMIGVTGFAPIGYGTVSSTSADNPEGFKGIFDGNGYVISNLTLDGDTYTSVGLFGIVSGTVKNLGLDNVNVTKSGTDDGRFGSLAGYVVTGGSVENCYVVNSTINASTSRVAGIIAGANYGGTISNCYTANCSYTAYTKRGGYIVGDNCNDVSSSDSAYAEGTVKNCYSDGANLTSTNTNTYNYVGTVINSETGVTADRFASGEIAYLLNGGDESGIWVQTIGTDSYPVFDGGTVYNTVFGYSNNESLGDIWADGVIDEKDAAALLKYISGIYANTDINDENADVNGDGSIDLLDSIAILNHLENNN